MKQQFTFLIVVSIGVLALSGIIVGDAKAARDLPPVPDVPSTDHLPLLRQTTDGWTCYVSPAGCPDPNDPVLPYIDEGSKDGWGFNASASATCSPQPDCIGPVYFYLKIFLHWNQWEVYGPQHIRAGYNINTGNYADADFSGWTECGTGFEGSCTTTYAGVLTPTASWTWDIGVSGTADISNPGYFYGDIFHYDYFVYFSNQPFDGGCEEMYVTPSLDTYEIDPTIELPEGTVGDPEPIDEQIYPTVIDSMYRVEINGGPWNDGTDDQDDVAVSWDGETWVPLMEVPSECMSQSSSGALLSTYIMAESETFYIRVNDTAGNFADNTVDPEDPPFTYSIGLSFVDATPPCEAQFSYDEGTDWVTSVFVRGDDDVGSQANMPLTTGEWYAIAVDDGSWQDEGEAPDRYDMEYYNGPDEFALAGAPYIDLTDGVGTAWCTSQDGKTAYIQAKDTSLWLRVNDPLGEFENNTGYLAVGIYHAAFTRTPATCEMQFKRESLISSGSVDAKQEGGMMFALSSPKAPIQTGLVKPGAWYYLETSGGPWQWKGASHSPYAIDYDMAIKDSGEWVSLTDWARAECVVEIDGLGHQAAYFQVPVDGAFEFKLRVNDSESWFNNSGIMNWNLYGASDLGIVPQDNCDFIYDQDHPSYGNWIPADSENGENMLGIYSGHIYAIKLRGDQYYWQEQTGGDPLYGVQISNDNGETWSDFPEGFGGSLCYMRTGNVTTAFIQTGQNQVWKMRVDSESFSDNIGGMGYQVFEANGGDTLDPWTQCFDGNEVFEINHGTSIPVKDEAGIYINGTNILAGGDEIQTLQPTETYKLEISDGPWNNGEGLDSYNAEISADNGVTWYALDDKTNPDIICGDQDFTGMYKSVYFTVQEGQRWKIRVADEAGAFTDNGGSLWYTLLSVSGADVPPVDVTVPMPVVNNICNSPLVRPTSILDVSRWVEFARQSVQRYFAWCPKHTNIIVSLMNSLMTREPFATAEEIDNQIKQIGYEVSAYGWGDAEDTSIFSVTSRQDLETKIIAKILPVNGLAWDMWSGDADIVDFSDRSMPDEYSSCNSSFAGFLPTSMLRGMCFVFGYFKSTGASFFIQLLIDIGAIFALLEIIKESLADTIYMVTGSKPWQGVKATIPGIQKSWGDVVKGRHGDDESLGPTDGDILAQQFGGRWDQGADGRWKRR